MTLKRSPELTFVCTFPPDRSELGDGAWVNSRLIDELGTEYDVTVLTAVAPSTSEPDISLEVRRSRTASLRTVMRMLLHAESYQEAKFKWHPSWRKFEQSLAAQANGGSTLVTTEWPALLACADLGIRPDLHIALNVDSVFAERFDPWILRIFGNARRMRSRERNLMSWPRRIAALSRRDVDHLASWGCRVDHIAVARLGPNRPAVGPLRRLGFIGKMSWSPNRDAALELVHETLPALRRAGLAASVVLAGRDSELFAGIDGVEAMGQVQHVDEFYSRVDAVVLPRSSVVTGVSVMVIEALERGVPVIAPAQIADDLDVHGILIADSASEVVAALSSGPADDLTVRVGGTRVLDLIRTRARPAQLTLGELRAQARAKLLRSREAMLDWVLDPQQRGMPRRLCTMNLQHVSLALKAPRFMSVLSTADAYTADGWPVRDWLHTRNGESLERTGGSDLLPLLFSSKSVVGTSWGLVGGTERGAAHLHAQLDAAGATLVLVENGPLSGWNADHIASRLNDEGVSYALVSAPLPTGELIAAELIEQGFRGTVVGVGAGLAMAAGEQARAPKVMQNLRLEWLYRLLQSPQRMFRRYIIDGVPTYIRMHANA